MNRDDAMRLADKITRIWPRGAITLDMWTEVLEELPFGPCEAALRKLRDNEEHPPSIAKLRGACSAELGTAREDRTECGTCGGDGWETVRADDESVETVMRPCRCANGNRVRDVHRRIVSHNDNELARLGRTPPEDATKRPDWITGRPLFGDNE